MATQSKKTSKLSSAAIATWAESLEVPKITDILPMVAHYDLPLAKRKVLATKMLPQTALWSERKKAEYAQVSEKHWYTVIKEPEFRAICLEAVRSQIGVKLAEVWNSFLANALYGDTQSQIVILREAGILTKESKEGGDTIVNFAVVEQKRKENRRLGLEQFGYVVPDPD